LIARFEEMLKMENEEFQPMTIQEFNKRIDKSMEDSKNGRLIESSKLKEKIEQWR